MNTFVSYDIHTDFWIHEKFPAHTTTNISFHHIFTDEFVIQLRNSVKCIVSVSDIPFLQYWPEFPCHVFYSTNTTIPNYDIDITPNTIAIVFILLSKSFSDHSGMDLHLLDNVISSTYDTHRVVIFTPNTPYSFDRVLSGTQCCIQLQWNINSSYKQYLLLNEKPYSYPIDVIHRPSYLTSSRLDHLKKLLLNAIDSMHYTHIPIIAQCLVHEMQPRQHALECLECNIIEFRDDFIGAYILNSYYPQHRVDWFYQDDYNDYTLLIDMYSVHVKNIQIVTEYNTQTNEYSITTDFNAHNDKFMNVFFLNLSQSFGKITHTQLSDITFSITCSATVLLLFPLE